MDGLQESSFSGHKTVKELDLCNLPDLADPLINAVNGEDISENCFKEHCHNADEAIRKCPVGQDEDPQNPNIQTLWSELSPTLGTTLEEDESAVNITSSDSVSSPASEIIYSSVQSIQTNSHGQDVKPENTNVEHISTPTPNEPEVTDVSVEKKETPLDILSNGQLIKTILQPGLGRDTRPARGDLLTISYECRLKSDPNTVVAASEELEFVLGDGDVIQGFDIALSFAEKHEVFKLEVHHRFAYGEKGLEDPLIPPCTDLVYTIRLINISDPPNYAEEEPQRRLQLSDTKHHYGNYYYKREEYSLAVNSYLKCLQILQTTPNVEQNSDYQERWMKVQNNLAVSYLKLENYAASIEACQLVLDRQSNNVKALFRMGCSLEGQGEYVEAINSFWRVLRLKPNLGVASERLAECRRKHQAESETRARVCRRMLGRDSGEKIPKTEVGPSDNNTQFWMRTFKLLLVAGSLLSVAWMISKK